MDDTLGETALAVVLVPSDHVAFLAAGHAVNVSIAVDVTDGEVMRPHHVRVNLVQHEIGALEPEHSLAVATRGEDVHDAIAVEVRGQCVRGAGLVDRDGPLEPWCGATLGLLPPREPIPSPGDGVLARRYNICDTVTIQISDAQIVAQARCVLVSQDVARPLFR